MVTKGTAAKKAAPRKTAARAAPRKAAAASARSKAKSEPREQRVRAAFGFVIDQHEQPPAAVHETQQRLDLFGRERLPRAEQSDERRAARHLARRGA